MVLEGFSLLRRRNPAGREQLKQGVRKGKSINGRLGSWRYYLYQSATGEALNPAGIVQNTSRFVYPRIFSTNAWDRGGLKTDVMELR
jgi:hypothetical protein